MRKGILRRRAVRFSLVVMLLGVFGGAAALTGSASGAGASTVTTSSLGTYSPTFVGPAATGCAAKGCSLLSGPFITSSSPSSASSAQASANAANAARAHALPAPNARRGALASAGAPSSTSLTPTINCTPTGPGCDSVSTSAGGAVGVKGLNAVDSAQHTTNIYKDVEPPDQGLCAGSGYAVEANNIGEMLVFDTSLNRASTPISLDSVMGLTSRGWSSGGDPSCYYDSANGGHWFFTQIVSSSPESGGGAFTGCFSAVASSCYEGISVSQGSSPLGPYYTYFLNANYNPSEPGYPYLLNDFAKISATRDAFLLFYDEFPLGSAPGVGGGLFNGAQEFAFDKTALETGQPVASNGGAPNRNFNVAIENMGNINTPDGTCAGSSGVDCWAAVIPAQPADAGQFDNSHGGSGFMMDSLDFKSFAAVPTSGDNRIAVWDWTGLSDLGSRDCGSCSGIGFGGQLFSGVEGYNDPETPNGFLGAQKAGPIPLGDECGAAGLATVTSCPEGGIETNGDFMTQVSQAQDQLWGPVTTEVNQTFGSRSETHEGVAYWVVGTKSFDSTGQFTLTDQGYASAAHEDLEMPAMAAEGTNGNGNAVMLFTLSGNGGPNGADHGGFYPSTAYGRLTSSSGGLTGSTINVADAGQSPQDGFSEYQSYPATRPRWGDYSWGIYLPDGSDRIYFANEYIQYPNCTGSAFDYDAIGTCGGTRDGQANWGTSVNYVVP